MPKIAATNASSNVVSNLYTSLKRSGFLTEADETNVFSAIAELTSTSTHDGVIIVLKGLFQRLLEKSSIDAKLAIITKEVPMLRPFSPLISKYVNAYFDKSKQEDIYNG